MKWRFRLILLFFVVLFLGIDARLYYWQVVRADELSQQGASQYGTEVKLIATRGEIKTSDDYSIAANKITYLVVANPKQIKDKDTVATLLSPLLKIEESTISARLSVNTFWAPLKSQVDDALKVKIGKLKITGLGFEDEQTRFYPEASMAGQLLGFVGKDEKGDQKGYFGLEGYYDKQLAGKTDIALRLRDAWGNPILSRMDTSDRKVDGRSLVLHVDRTIQYVLEQELKYGIAKYGAQSGMAAVIDPKTGGILAMSAFPDYDPQNYQDFSDDLYRNPFISDSYEPGSTFKSIVMASAIDAGVVEPDTKCDICGGPVKIGDYSIKTWNDKYIAGSTMIDVIKNSDNTGMVFAGRKLGLDRMFDYFKKFGFDDITGIDLQGEAATGLRPKDQWYPIDLATSTFGQGITVSPIQLLTAFASIANNGEIMEPHVVDSIETPDGEIIKIPPRVVSQPIAPETAKIMKEILVNAVDNGEAKWAKPKGYRIAGKTGTAQIAVAGHYDANKTIASFIGFAPADDPKFAMLVIINKPSTSIYGSETAAPIFFNVAQKILTYYNIPPTDGGMTSTMSVIDDVAPVVPTPTEDAAGTASGSADTGN